MIASYLAQIIELPPAITDIGIAGIIAAAVLTLAVVLLIGMRTISPIINLLTTTFRAMQDSNNALLKRLEQSDQVIDRNTQTLATIPTSLEQQSADNAKRVSAITESVGSMSRSIDARFDDLKTHVTATGETTAESVISVVEKAAITLAEIKTQVSTHEQAAAEQSAALLQRLQLVEKTILEALERLTDAQTTPTVTASAALVIAPSADVSAETKAA